MSANGQEANGLPDVVRKDTEGVSEGNGGPIPGVDDKAKERSAGGGSKRQKKIAVLTSGGDSAGMNAAGE